MHTEEENRFDLHNYGLRSSEIAHKIVRITQSKSDLHNGIFSTLRVRVRFFPIKTPTLPVI